MKKKYFELSNGFLKGNQKENWEAIKNECNGLSVACSALTELVDDNRFRVLMSTPKKNRNDYEIMQTFDFKAYKENPILVDNHRGESITDIIGKVENIRKNKDGNYEGDTIFALSNPKGALAYDMAKDGFLNAVSITIMPLEFDDKGRITKSEVLELSYVLVPADRKTLVKRNNKKDDEVKNCKDCKKDEDVIEEVKDEVVEEDVKETPKEQKLRIIKQHNQKKVEYKKELLAGFNSLKNDENLVDTRDKRVKMANRFKKLINKSL